MNKLAMVRRSLSRSCCQEFDYHIMGQFFICRQQQTAGPNGVGKLADATWKVASESVFVTAMAVYTGEVLVLSPKDNAPRRYEAQDSQHGHHVQISLLNNG